MVKCENCLFYWAILFQNVRAITDAQIAPKSVLSAPHHVPRCPIKPTLKTGGSPKYKHGNNCTSDFGTKYAIVQEI